MIAKRSLLPLAPLAFAALLLGCTQKNTGDEPPASNVPAGLERFLLFPNPIAQSSGGFETDTNAYADAYYSAIDPAGAKDTLGKWMALNGFGSGGAEYRAVFRDVKDLGYGRNMNGRVNSDGSIAFFVENYNVGYTSTLNVDVAIARDKTWHVGTNAIEWSATPCVPGVDPADCSSTVKFAKYYNFSAADGTRQLAVDLDGKGKKAMPGPCITCHGGRGDPLTPADASTNKPRFPLVENSLSRKRGDVEGRLHGMNVDSFQFSAQATWTRPDQEAILKTFNQWILCTYPLPAGSPSDPTVDACRVAAGPNEWQGTAAGMIKSWYGGTGTNGMPNSVFADNYIPSGPSEWNTGTTIPNTTPPLTDQTLYREVVAPFCRTCHILRGTANQSDLDFMTLAKFQSYGDRIKAHVFDRGTMPLALIVYNDFWSSSAPDTLANAINPSLAALTPPETTTDSSGHALKPGRPVADPGPSRMVRSATSAILSAENSLFASAFHWSSSSVTITNPDSMIATFPPSPAGSYTVTLTVGNGTATDTKDVVITVDDSFPDPATLKFAHVENILQNVLHNGTTKCTSCHESPAVSPTPPIFYNSFDLNGDLAVNGTDEAWLYKEVTGRVNLTEIQASPLLRKPSGHHHRGGTLFDVTTSAGLQNYSILYNWILAGMPAGGVAANPVVNGGVDPAILTFTGTFPGPYSASIPLDGSQSVGPSGVTLAYSWSLVSQPPGGNAVIGDTALATTTLTMQNVGVYVVQLQVTGGGFTDTVQRTFTVSETPIVADFTPQTGSTAVSFSSSPARGNITLTNASTAGSPNNCRWQVLSGPAGATLDGSAVLDVTKPCTVTINIFPFGTFTFPNSATLNVPFTAVNGTYVVQFTASTIGSSSVTHNITVTNGTPVTASISVTSPTALAFSGSPPFAFVSLSGAASSGVQPLSYAWSITAAPAGAVTPSAITTGFSTSTLTARATGSYTVHLLVTDAASNTATTNSTFSVTPSRGTTFATMTGLFVSIGCTGCHSGNGNPAINAGIPPSWVNVTGVDGSSLWQRVSERAFNGSSATFNTLVLNPQNITDATYNPNGHGGLCQPGFGCSNNGSANLTSFENWTQDGSPPGN